MSQRDYSCNRESWINSRPCPKCGAVVSDMSEIFKVTWPHGTTVRTVQLFDFMVWDGKETLPVGWTHMQRIHLLISCVCH